jgi:hypothetical protein
LANGTASNYKVSVNRKKQLPGLGAWLKRKVKSACLISTKPSSHCRTTKKQKRKKERKRNNCQNQEATQRMGENLCQLFNG